jgi:predicted aspartyl protease
MMIWDLAVTKAAWRRNPPTPTRLIPRFFNHQSLTTYAEFHMKLCIFFAVTLIAETTVTPRCRGWGERRVSYETLRWRRRSAYPTYSLGMRYSCYADRRTGLILAIGLTALFASASAAQRTSQPKPPKSMAPSAVVVEHTLEAALGQPRVHAQLRGKKGPLTAKPQGDENLRELLGDDRTVERSFIAFLDTGASGHVISKSTAERFGIVAEENAVYHEVGLHGETAVGVSVPYELAIAGIDGAADGEPPADDFATLFENVAFQLTREKPTGLMAMMGELNVIGMPAIRTMVLAIDPSPMRGGGGNANADPLDALKELTAMANGPAVRIIQTKSRGRRERNQPDDREAMQDADIAIALEYEDFNQRKHPGNRGALPDLASNPMVPAVKCGMAHASIPDQSKPPTKDNAADDDDDDAKALTATGDWLLDTGAAASIISVKTAQSLGLYDDQRNPIAKPEFTLPLGGASGEVKPANGYIIDSIKIAAKGGKTIEFRQARVVVQDVGIKLVDGTERILDGVLGMNFLLPSGADFGKGMPAKTDDGAFEMIWIDGPRAALLLELKK